MQGEELVMTVAGYAVLLTAMGLLWLASRKKELLHAELAQQLQNEAAALRETLQVKEEEIGDYRAGFETVVEQKNELARDHAVLQSRFDEARHSHEEKIKLLEEAKQSLKVQFENLANQIFEQKSKSFEETSQKRLDLLLKPFREQISHFSKQTEERFVKESNDRTLLQKEISLLKNLNERISEDALNLTKALKGENKTQGNWGEIVLERILEESGLREGSEYETQGSFKDEAGKTLRPDVIVHLPQEKDIVIDSKVSLLAYEAFMKAVEPAQKEQALKAHLASIYAHIKGLSEKRYEKLEGVRTLDFVLLFMPIEGAFLLALEQDSEFFKKAYEHNIMVVGPSTLLVTLRTIEHIWRTERQEQNAQEIVLQAERLYDKLVLFVDDMQKIGDQLGRTNETYEKAMNKLTTGKGNLIGRAEKMHKLGLKPKKAIAIKSDESEEDE